MSQAVEIWTDGACSGNPGPGGWAAVLRFGEHQKELFGSEPETTNQRMELLAAIEALKSLKKPGCSVTLYSDSAYLVNAMTKGWLENWRSKGWKNSKGKPVANVRLWELLVEAAEGHEVRWMQVKGHAQDTGNNRADALAYAASQGARWRKDTALTG